MEFLNGIFILVEFSGHKTESSHRFEFSTLIFPFYKMLLMNRLTFSCTADFFKRIFKQEKRMVFFKIRQLKGLWIAWSKRPESFVKMMSKNSISGKKLLISSILCISWLKLEVQLGMRICSCVRVVVVLDRRILHIKQQSRRIVHIRLNTFDVKILLPNAGMTDFV